MKILRTLIILHIIFTFNAYALNLQSILDDFKKVNFPDTSEIQMEAVIKLSNMEEQVVKYSTINGGKNRSSTTIKSKAMNLKIIENHGQRKIIDLKTNKTLPLQNIPNKNPSEILTQIENLNDYNTPQKIDTLWKIFPKDPTKPILYISDKLNQITKTEINLNETLTTTIFEYCNKNCNLKNSLKKITITTQKEKSKSTVILNIISVKKRMDLPDGIFDVNE